MTPSDVAVEREHPAPADPAVRLRQAAFLRGFVGRRAELHEFREALDGRPDDVTVLAWYGPGGIGKTMLLQRLSVEAVRMGRDVVEVDVDLIEPTTEAFAAAAVPPGPGRVVLLVDGAERLDRLEGWFRDRFLLSLTPGSLVVLAGRQPPSPRWRSDPAWQDGLIVRALEGLGREDSARVLADAMPASAVGRRQRIAFSHGHPLALRLLGQESGYGPEDGWCPSPPAVAELLRRVVDPAPSAVHRQALEICAHVPDVTEDLLRLFMPEQAYDVFDWLRRLPYVSAGRTGLRLLPVVAEAVDRDLRWRAPDLYLSMHKALRSHVQDMVRDRREPESLRAAAVFNHLQAHGSWMLGYDWSDRHDSVYEIPCDAAGMRQVRELAHTSLGESGLAVVDFWLHRQSENFRLYRSADTGETVGCLALLRLGRWDAAETAVDPVVRAVRDHAEAEGGLRPGRGANLMRFAFTRKRSAERLTVLPRMLAQVTREVLSQERLDWTFFAVRGDARLNRLLESADFRRLPETLYPVEERVTLFGHDWRARGVSEWADRLDNRMFHGFLTPDGTSAPRATVFSRASFDDAVHDALRTWHQRERLADNPLLHAAFVVQSSGDPEKILRALIVQAVEAIGQDPRAKWQRAAVWATYLNGENTQQAVARELSVSFSTYRRYLKRGVERVCWYLWEHEMTHIARARTEQAGSGSTAATGPLTWPGSPPHADYRKGIAAPKGWDNGRL
ncbi:hypothetical protein ACIHIX_45925 [Streptomyces sp. NPDC051913]|uniref:hypothetical protein n=1 Tax=Streptomyces sp. NPDC051913 TaxID=3365676 RepID=UPI0037D12E8C